MMPEARAIRNGKWMNNLATDKTAVGTATLTPDGDKMVFKYNLDADRVSGSGEFRLERLF